MLSTEDSPSCFSDSTDNYFRAGPSRAAITPNQSQQCLQSGGRDMSVRFVYTLKITPTSSLRDMNLHCQVAVKYLSLPTLMVAL